MAEVAQSHEGSLGLAMSFIRVAKQCGAHAIKFQTHIADAESTPHEPWRVPFSQQDSNRHAYWKRMEFTFEQWQQLKQCADDCGIIFLSSPFSLEACRWLQQLGVPAWKIASGEMHNPELLTWVRNTGEPVILSTGLSAAETIRKNVDFFQSGGCDVALLHCTTEYPTPSEKAGLNLLSELQATYPDLPVGLSDHSGQPYAGILSSYLGASLIEVHLTLHPQMFGPDVSSSLTPEQLTCLVQGSEAAWRMRAHPVPRYQHSATQTPGRRIFGRSWYTTRPLLAGHILQKEDLAYKKPGGGMEYEALDSLLGKTVLKALPLHHPFLPDDVS